MKKRVFGIILALFMLVSSSGMITLAADATTVATIDGTAYTSLQAAVDAFRIDKDSAIQLKKDSVERIQVESDVYIDLNGKNIPSVAVSDGTCYVMDTATADFVAESANDYGTIGLFAGNVQAAFSPEEDGCGYLMFSEGNKKASFHYVQLQITDMVLRPRNAGETQYNPSLYYKSAFSGDEVVAANVESFGVALSLVDEPGKLQLKNCGYTELKGFNPGANGNAPHSTLLSGIMKESNSQTINKRNAGMMVYGQAYLKLQDGSCVFGNAGNRTLQEQTELVNRNWTVMTAAEKDIIRGMYNRYPEVMKSWNLSGIQNPYGDVVEDAVTWYQTYEKIPVANADMTEDELRKICVDYFRTYLSFKWTPNKEFKYLDHEGDWTTLSPGVVFTGMPYCMDHAHFDSDGDGELDKDENGRDKEYGIGDGSIYKILNYYDPATGVLDTQKMGTPKNVFNILTGHCTSGLRGAWHRVSNSVKLYTSPHWVPANGMIPIGKYVWNEYETTYITARNEICQVEDAISKVIAANTKGVFYSAFAKMQPGDGLLSDGHVMMCTDVEVVYKADGSIDSGKSYIWYIDQNSNGSTDRWIESGGVYANTYTYRQKNGHLVRNLGGLIDDPVKGNKKSFFDMLKAGYIPVTIPEFCTEAELRAYKNKAATYFLGTDREGEWNTVYAPAYDAMITHCTVENGSTTSSNNLETLTSIKVNTLYNTFGGGITANYNISTFCVSLEDPDGNVLMAEKPPITTSDRTYSIKIKELLGKLEIVTQEALEPYADGKNVIKIQFRLVNGQWVDVLNAKLKA